MNFFDVLESTTVLNSDHLEYQDGDTLTVRQIKGLSNEVTVLRKEIEAKNNLIEPLKVQGKTPGVGMDSGLMERDFHIAQVVLHSTIPWPQKLMIPNPCNYFSFTKSQRIVKPSHHGTKCFPILNPDIQMLPTCPSKSKTIIIALYQGVYNCLSFSDFYYLSFTRNMHLSSLLHTDSLTKHHSKRECSP